MYKYEINLTLTNYSSYFLTKLAILCRCGLTLLFRADIGEAGAGDGGVALLFCFVWATVCSLRTCSFAPLKINIAE